MLPSTLPGARCDEGTGPGENFHFLLSSRIPPQPVDDLEARCSLKDWEQEEFDWEIVDGLAARDATVVTHLDKFAAEAGWTESCVRAGETEPTWVEKRPRAMRVAWPRFGKEEFPDSFGLCQLRGLQRARRSVVLPRTWSHLSFDGT